jgi:hypothetical protein
MPHHPGGPVPQYQQRPPMADDGWSVIRPQPVPLILVEQPVSIAGRAPVQPGRALLYADRSGQVTHVTRPLGPVAIRRYSWRYEVDLSDHFAALRMEVPSRSQAARFRITMDVGWRVTDPARIVTARIGDGDAIVRSWVSEAISPICRAYEIHEDAALERTLTDTLGHGRTHSYPEGIVLFRFSASVAHDRRAAEWMIEQVDAQYEAASQKEGMDRLRQEINSEEDLILLLLQRAPDRVGDVIADIRKRKELSMQSRIELFNKMVDNDLIQEAEIESIRQMIIRPIEEIAGSTPTGMFGVEQLPAPQAPQAIGPASVPVEEDEDVL